VRDLFLRRVRYLGFLCMLRLLCLQLLLFRSGIISGLFNERLQFAVGTLLTFCRSAWSLRFSLCNPLDLGFGRWNGFGWQSLRHRSLLCEFVPELFGLPLRNALPTSFDLRLSELFRNLGLRRSDRFQLLRRRNDVELVTLYCRFEGSVTLRLGRIIDLVIRDLLARLLLNQLRNPLVSRSIVVNCVIVIRNVRCGALYVGEASRFASFQSRINRGRFAYILVPPRLPNR